MIDKINDAANGNNAARIMINENKTITIKSFEYETKLTESTPNNNNILEAEVVVLWKYLSNFGRSLDLPAINFEIEIDLSWSKEFIIPEISITPRIAGNPNTKPPVQAREAIKTTGATFKIINPKLYVPIVTLSIKDNINLLENTKQSFKRAISRNKYRSEITAQPKINNLDYPIDPTLRNINRLFVI